MHWWHPERLGVRTRISDDTSFLPYVTAAYVEYTGDRDILRERVAYLKNVEIPEGGKIGMARRRFPRRKKRCRNTACAPFAARACRANTA